jgi:hypothetical protein
MNTYVDTTLVECNRKSSPQYLGGNNANPHIWQNKCGDGITLNIGDKISVHSSYISEIGNESATIEFLGKSYDYIHNASNVTYVKTTNDEQFGNVLYEFSASDVEIPLKDNEMTLTHSYYKTTNADSYYFSLPRGGTWNDNYNYIDGAKIWLETNTKLNGSLLQATTTYYQPDYNTIYYYANSNGERIVNGSASPPDAKRFEVVNDGSRYTLFVQKNIYNYVNASFGLDQRRDPALYDYIWYKKTNTYQLPIGFNSPANIGSILTTKLSEVVEIENQTLYDESASLTNAPDKQWRIALKAKTKTNETFPCATGWGTGSYVSANFHSYNDGLVNVTSTYTGDPSGVNGLQVTEASFNAVRFGMKLTNDRPNLSASFVGAIIIGKHAFPGIDPGDPTIYRIYFDRTIDQSDNANDHVYKFERTELYYQYQSSYSTIGVKRPELFEYGRKINIDTTNAIDGSMIVYAGAGASGTNHGTYYHPISSASNANPNVLTTNWAWTDDNLTLLKDYFSQQKLYPEIFRYVDMSPVQQSFISGSLTDQEKQDNINISKTRFLHMNDENLYTTLAYHLTGGAIGTNSMIVTGSFSSDNLKKGMFLTGNASGLTTGTIITNVSGLSASLATLTLSNNFTSTASGAYVFTQRKLGNDYYNNASGTNGEEIVASDVTLDAPALFFDFNPERENENNGFGTRYDDLRYGFGVRIKYNSSYYIGFRFDTNVGGMSKEWFNASGIMNNTVTLKSIGFDSHFSSYGNAFINLSNGIAGAFGSIYNGSATSIGSTQPEYFQTYLERTTREGYDNASNSTIPIEPTQFRLTKAMNEIYIGANNPILEFDGITSRFQFRLLHTPETIQQPTGLNVQSAAVGVNVYKLNKVINQNNYSPSFTPYSYNFVGSEILLDPNIAPYSIMDAHSGIFIEDFGVDEDNWKNSVWELLGFTYEQLHKTFDTRLDRITSAGLRSSVATTNALLESSQLAQYRRDKSKLVIFDPVGNNYPLYKVTQADFYAEDTVNKFYINPDYSALGGLNVFSEISQNCSSTTIRAENLPRKMITPFYTIRSDLLSSGYIGGREGNSSLPIIAICSKDNGYGDYYTGADGEQFTNTIPRTIQNITTTITNPDGSPARVDDGSCVIYRIQRSVQDNSQLYQQILMQQQQQQQKK